MVAAAPIAFTSDSARVVGEVYGASIIITVPLVAALVVGLCLRGAGLRVVVWRCTIVAMLGVMLGRLAPFQWNAWLLPDALAWPLLKVGTLQLSFTSNGTGASPSASSVLLQGLLLVWVVGVVVVMLPLLVGRLRLHRARRSASRLDSRRWRGRLRDACALVGVRPDSVQLVASPLVSVPMTWGTLRHVIVLPASGAGWPRERVQAVLVHELAHVRGRDAALLLVARLVCAAFWFHPGVWWLARRFAADSEVACDDRVLASGVRRSDYAAWLAASTPIRGTVPGLPAMALAGRGLRQRIAAIVDTSRRVDLPTRRAVASILTVSVVLLAPLSTVRVAPTRGYLTALMEDVRWQSRAWAVIRLAQRPDSIEVARGAARHDPDPSVRAWARYALDLATARPLRVPRP
jgi:beta-lactamase regulating signal transducer with metallopeptidase domain